MWYVTLGIIAHSRVKTRTDVNINFHSGFLSFLLQSCDCSLIYHVTVFCIVFFLNFLYVRGLTT